MEKIILEIDQMGNVRGEVQGVKGQICTKNVGWLESILGRVKSRTFKKEYYDHELVRQK